MVDFTKLLSVRLVAGASIAAAGVVALSIYNAPVTQAPPPAPVCVETETQDTVIEPAIASEASTLVAPTRTSRDVSLVFSTEGHTFMKIADLDADHLPAHVAPTLMHSTKDYTYTATANVAAAEVPQYTPWLMRDVIVDGVCTARVTGFAIASRVSGDIGYADSQGAENGESDTEWTAHSVLRLGSPMLVAELEGCPGGKVFARGADLKDPIAMRVVQDKKLAGAAKRALIRSPQSAAAQKEWDDPEWAPTEMPKKWYADPSTTWTTQILVHPVTGAKFVSVHAAQPFTCGTPFANVWGLYRVGDDNALVPVANASLGDISDIEELVDLDGDGELEVIGVPFIGGRIVNDIHGTTLQKLDEQFYGCPC
ncbi:MAG TPA: hypothetical protein VGM90_16965 [Kofleriaceae bacterium]|jgi:hypothetical protein